MQALLEIRAVGAHASIQDQGRHGYRRLGIPGSGTLAPRMMRLANALAGNPQDHPIIECIDGGQHFVAGDVGVRLAVAGHACLQLDAGAYPERRTPTPWRSFLLEPGQGLRIRSLQSGRLVIVAVTGLDVPFELGSASCYARAGLGGHPLAAGDTLTAAGARRKREQVLLRPPEPDTHPVRVIMGPQQDHFTQTALRTFLNSEYHVSTAADRMGMRLEGPRLQHRKGHSEIVSDATVPGAIQVPGEGQPIVLLADGQTAGGYPKIASVISSDLERLANLRPGERVCFTAIDPQTAADIAHDSHRHLLQQCENLHAFDEGGVDVIALRQLYRPGPDNSAS